MPSLASVGRRFHKLFQVIEGGTGYVRGVMSEVDQEEQPSFIFVQPRHVLRTPYPSALKSGMVIRAESNTVFIVGDNGPSENYQGILWNSFRLFEATGQYQWGRLLTEEDFITHIPRTDPEPIDLGMVWAAIEGMDREVSDREQRVVFGQHRVIAGADLREGDLLDNRTVTKLDRQLGLAIGVIT